MKNCEFCGKLVLVEYLQRKRKNPEGGLEFFKICDRCNHAYLERKTLLPFWNSSQRIREILDQKEDIYNKLNEKLQNLERETFQSQQKVAEG